jgi:transposase
LRTTPAELDRLWSSLPGDTEPGDVLVVMEPTRNAWVPLAAWFRRKGARVVLVPPERSADLRDYYAKHTKSDRLDSQLLVEGDAYAVVRLGVIPELVVAAA